MPFTANRQFKAKPRLLDSADGMYFSSDDSRKELDGTAGLWCCNGGHGRREITETESRQIAKLDFAPTFRMGHPLPFELASRHRPRHPHPHPPGYPGAGAAADRGKDAD